MRTIHPRQTIDTTSSFDGWPDHPEDNPEDKDRPRWGLRQTPTLTEPERDLAAWYFFPQASSLPTAQDRRPHALRPRHPTARSPL
jgi:hypothetical protein